MDGLILVVDDEPKIVRLIRDYLEKEGFRVLTAGEGSLALAMARRERPDLIILDLMLPGMDGWEITRTLRKETDTPILMLTARVEESDQIVGLELGADDYITKPFSPRAVVARVRAILRRTRGEMTPVEAIRVGGLEIDLTSRDVTLAGRDLRLTPNEFDLLVALARAPGRIFSREQLAKQIHGDAAVSFDRSIDSHVKNLRKKLGAADPEREWIETVYGVGYRLKGAG